MNPPKSHHCTQAAEQLKLDVEIKSKSEEELVTELKKAEERERNVKKELLVRRIQENWRRKSSKEYHALSLADKKKQDAIIKLQYQFQEDMVGRYLKREVENVKLKILLKRGAIKAHAIVILEDGGQTFLAHSSSPLQTIPAPTASLSYGEEVLNRIVESMQWAIETLGEAELEAWAEQNDFTSFLLACRSGKADCLAAAASQVGVVDGDGVGVATGLYLAGGDYR